MSLLETIFVALVDTSWRASCLILVLLGLRAWTRGQVAARLMFWVWIAVAVRLLLPISLPAAWSPFNLAPWIHLSGKGAMPPAGLDPVPPGVESPIAAPGLLTAPNDAIPFTAALSPGGWAALIWVGGMAALLLARLWAWGRFALEVRRSAILPHRAARSLLADAIRSLGAGDHAVLVTDAVKAPALFGLHRPRILFPPGFLERLSPSEIRSILAHELAHARRRDLLADALLQLAVVVHWFNPLIWIATRTARQDCELACDESVVHRMTADERGNYGATLLRVARLTNKTSGSGFALGVVSSRGHIKQRIQMIAAHRSFTVFGTLLGGAVSLGIVALSFTSATTAQVTPVGASPTAAQSVVGPSPESVSSGIVYDPAIDRLDTLFPTGVVATVADRSITVADVRRYIAPVIPQLQRNVRNQDEFNGKLAVLQNSAVRDLVNRTLLIRQFHDQREGEEARQVAGQHIDTAIADTIAERFEGDRSKFLSYLKSKGQTQRDYRKEIEEDIIYNYMRAQERKVSGTVDRTVPARETRTVRLRLILLLRADGETDAALLQKAHAILDRFRAGESFAALAREFDQSGRKERGGDWGWQSPADLRTEYRDTFLALKKGDVSAPILVGEACALLYAEDRR